MASENSPKEGQPEADNVELDLEIETIGAWVPELQERVDPHRAPDLCVTGCGQPPRSGRRLYVEVGAVKRILGHAESNPCNEVGGVLLGFLYISRGSLVTEVRQAVAAPLTRAGGTHVTFSHDTWTAIFEQMDPEQGLSIVGWYHSHPRLGVFLSRQDEFIQENFFDNPGHVALVVDPNKRPKAQIGAYTWHEGRVGPLPGFWVSAPHNRSTEARLLASRLHYQAAGEQIPQPGLMARLMDGLLGPMRRD